MNFRFVILLGFILFIFFSVPCYSNSQNQFIDNTLSLKDMSDFFAGKSLSESSGLYPLLKKQPIYFSSNMNAYWTEYKQKTADPVKAWSREWLNNDNLETCFYPFAGADFINAYLMYPNAKTYILIGLETFGGIPDFEKMSDGILKKGFKLLVRGYRVFIRLNFYRTLGMAVDMNMSPFEGTFPHMLVQMSWLGLIPAAVHSVEITKDSALKYTKLKKGQLCESGAIEFIDTDGTRKKVMFLHLDLANASLSKEKLWRKYLENLKPVDGIFKAASFLPPRSNFSIIRDICLSNMDVIVQDDSAIPFEYFKDGWNITLFGNYTKPHPLFRNFIENDLKEAFKKVPVRPLSFQFGYDKKDKSNCLLLMRKKK